MKSKSIALDQMRFSGAMRYTLPWLYDDIEEIDQLFGGDPWPYGVEPNQLALDALARYLLAQKLVPRPWRSNVRGDVTRHFVVEQPQPV